MFRFITAKQELAISRQVAGLLPALVKDGVSLEDAVALAHNLCLLYYVLVLPTPLNQPKDLLDQLSLDEIATLCTRYYETTQQGDRGKGEILDTSTKITKA